MKTGYSVKEYAKREWRKFFILKKIKKYINELSFLDRLRFIVWGKFK